MKKKNNIKLFETTQQRNDQTMIGGYASQLKLPINFLIDDCQLHEKTKKGRCVIEIPYFNEGNTKIDSRYLLNSRPPFSYDKTPKELSTPYGVQRLSSGDKPKRLILTDNEPDCHVLWHHKFKALCLPGWDTKFLDQVANYIGEETKIYLMSQPGSDFNTFCDHLSESELRKKIKLLTLGDSETIIQLHLSKPKKFKDRFKEAIKESKSLIPSRSKDKTKNEKQLFRLCEDIASNKNILDLYYHDALSTGIIGEEANLKLLYLALTSRLSDIIVSEVIIGETSSGKSDLVKAVLKFIPDSVYSEFTSMSSKALTYFQGSFKHRFLVIFELAGIEDQELSHFIRTLLTENVIKYQRGRRLITLEGPTGLLSTTTQKNFYPDNETRHINLYSDSSLGQTKKVIRSIGRKYAHPDESQTPTDFKKWQAYQSWLELKPYNVVVPFGATLSELINPVAARMRRDVKKLFELIKAHAFLHQKNRKINDSGYIKATIKDYQAVYDLLKDSSDQRREFNSHKDNKTYKAIREILDGEESGKVPLSLLAEKLKVDTTGVSKKIKKLAEMHYLSKEKVGKSLQIKLLDEVTMEGGRLPAPDDVKKALEKKRKDVKRKNN